MARNGLGAGVIAALALALAACSSNSKVVTVNPNIYPAKYKQEIIATLRSVLNDPTHVRNALISDPALTPVGNEQRYAACVRLTERDPYTQQYAGPKTRIAYFFGGSLNQFVTATDDQCAKAAYKPFPEAEKLCLVAKCA